MAKTKSAPALDAEGVAARFLELPKRASAESDLTRRGRFLSCDFEVGVGAIPLLVSIAEGQVREVRRGPFLLRPWTFAIRADADTWARFLEPVPAAGWHDILALSKTGRLRIEGDLQPFMGNLQYVKDVLALARTAH